MHVEIISIGDELANGQRLDTNSQWISQKLGELGLKVLFHTTVADDLASNIEVFRLAARRADLVICTGGLGPTADDLTREAMATAFDRQLVVDENSLLHIEQLFAKRRRPMPERNRVQALFPSGSQVIPNPHGSAPGIDLQVETQGRSCRLFALPGVPAEMKEMFDATIVERLRKDYGVGRKQLYYKSIKLFGIGESDVEVRLPDLIKREREPRVGITVSHATITLRIATEASSAEESQRLMQSTQDEIYAALQDLIFGEGEIELEHAVIDLLHAQNVRLATVEVGPETLVGRGMLEADRRAPFRMVGSLALRNKEQVDSFVNANRRYPEILGSIQIDETHRFEFPDAKSNGTEDSQREILLWKELAAIAKGIYAADWILLLGDYPERDKIASSKSIPTESVTVGVLNPTNQLTLRRFELGAHPDVLYHRLAKTGLDQLRRALRDSKRS